MEKQAGSLNRHFVIREPNYQAYEKILNLTSPQRNIKENHTWVLLYTHQDEEDIKDVGKNTELTRM